MNHQSIVFVDPMSSADYLAKILRKYKLPNAAVNTLGDIDNGIVTHGAKYFDQIFTLDAQQSNMDALIRDLKALKPLCLYYGSDAASAVAITDILAQAVSPEFANPVSSSSWRADKFLMQEHLKTQGLNVVKQMKIATTLTAEQKAEITSWNIPVIIKPLNGSGSHGVKICNSLADLDEYLAVPLSHNYLGHEITAFIVQEYLTGVEFLVDSFSVRGKHYVSSVQRYAKKLHCNHPMYLYMEVILNNDPLYEQITEYLPKVLNAIEFHNGFAHSEVMLTERGPYLIEVNPRISGANGLANQLAQASGGLAQVDLLKLFYRQHTIPLSICKIPTRGIFLQSYYERPMRAFNYKLAQSLPSFKEASVLYPPGTMLHLPKSFLDFLGSVILSHADAAQVEYDWQQMLLWQEQGLLY